MWRAPRGRVGHRRADCPHLRGKRVERIDRAEVARLCTVCACTCVVCQTDPGRPTHCPHGHALCEECLESHLDDHLRTRPEALLRCPCGDGEPLDLETLPPSTLRRWLHSVVRVVGFTARRTSRLESVGVALCHEAQALACPRCGRGFADFDGCAAIHCPCGAFFCALCLQDHATSEDAHAHVLACPHNPDADEYGYYVPLTACRRAWLQRARRRLRDALWRLWRADGLLLAWGALCAVGTRDPSLVLSCLLTPPSALSSSSRGSPPRPSCVVRLLQVAASGAIGAGIGVMANALLNHE